MLAGAGITSLNTQLLLQGMQNVVSFAGAITGALITDRIGRRVQLLSSTSIVVVLFVIVLVLNSINVVQTPNGDAAKSSSAAIAEIAMIYIFGFVISAGWTPNQAMYPVECLRYEARAKGMGMYNVSKAYSRFRTKVPLVSTRNITQIDSFSHQFCVNIAGFYNTFVTGIAFTNAGWKYYFLFVFWDVFECLVIYFLFVETRKRTLEELTEIFRAKNPVKHSLEQTEIIVYDGHISELQNKDVWAAGTLP